MGVGGPRAVAPVKKPVEPALARRSANSLPGLARVPGDPS
uniref:WH2 domain-containing protein n=1 Tax=Macrostomum lignano TaxID=282301 RepID=A0A1I8FJS4_9PLAT